jgi:hypothetical protein
MLHQSSCGTICCSRREHCGSSGVPSSSCIISCSRGEHWQQQQQQRRQQHWAHQLLQLGILWLWCYWGVQLFAWCTACLLGWLRTTSCSRGGHLQQQQQQQQQPAAREMCCGAGGLRVQALCMCGGAGAPSAQANVAELSALCKAPVSLLQVKY